MHERELYPYWDDLTYYSRELYEEVTITGDLKKVWATKSRFRGGRTKTLEVQDILDQCNDKCPICSNDLDYGLGKNNHIKGDNHTPSLDQKIPREAGGAYIVGNIWVICERCNRLKNSAHGEEDALRLETIAKVLRDTSYAETLIEGIKK